MAELATIARPYAEALFKADGVGDQAALAHELQRPRRCRRPAELRRFADNPKVTAEQVFDLVTSVARPDGSAPLSKSATNLLRTVIDNDRLVALPEIALQFQALLDARSGTSTPSPTAPSRSRRAAPRGHGDAGAALPAQSRMQVVVRPELIGGIRVIVGDEVLDTSIQARLEQMKAALRCLSGAVALPPEEHPEFQLPARTGRRRPPCN